MLFAHCIIKSWSWMSTLKTGHYKKDYHELVTTSFVYYIMDFEMKKELN